MLPARRLAALLSAAAVVLAASACGGNDPTPSAAEAADVDVVDTQSGPTPVSVLDAAKANAEKARSGAVDGTIGAEGEAMEISFKGTQDGRTADVTLDFGDDGSTHMIAVNGVVYITGDGPFSESFGTDDKFIKISSKETEGIIKEFTVESLVAQVFGDLKPENLSGELAEETLGDVECWVLTHKDGPEKGSLFVSKDDLNLVRFVGGDDTPAELDFAGWNAKLEIKAPAKKDVWVAE
jgi:hypothetical protein